MAKMKEGKQKTVKSNKQSPAKAKATKPAQKASAKSQKAKTASISVLSEIIPSIPSKKYDFKEIESSVTSHWKANEDNIIKKSISYDKNREIFSWVEGPPTANAPPGLHHVEVRVFKDLFCRFKYMQGYTVPRMGGWDCHGLPVEVQVEKN
jgi:hypothetical protein